MELDDDKVIAQSDIRRLAIRYHGPEHGEQLACETFSKQQRVSLRLKVERVIEDDLNDTFYASRWPSLT